MRSEALSVLERLFDWVWQTSWEASLLALLVLLARSLLRKPLGPRGCYLLGSLVLLRLFLPAVPASYTSIWNVLAEPRSPIQTASASTAALPAISESSPGDSIPSNTTATSIVFPVHAPGSQSGIVSAFGGERSSGRTLLSVLWLAGFVSSVLIVGWQYSRFAGWLRSQQPVLDPNVLAILREAKGALGVSKHVELIATDRGTPALFGYRKPRLILPTTALDRLTGGELKLVLLHELAHLKRRDILWNWVIILARAIHWFNPIISLALRSLRADRELVCDSLVLNALNGDSRREYGDTLLKLLEGFSQSRPCPNFVPIIGNKHEIKRRIIMISQYKPRTRAAALLTSVLVVVLCCLTFTKAADRARQTEGPQAPKAGSEELVNIESSQSKTKLRERLAALEDRIQMQTRMVDDLRTTLQIPAEIAEGRSAPVAVDTIRKVEQQRISAASTAARHATFKKQLHELNEAEIPQVLATAYPDTELTQLLRELNSAEMQKVRFTTQYGSEHPEVKNIAATIKELKAQLDERARGVLKGLEVQAAAEKAMVDTMTKHGIELAMRETEMARSYRPYFKAKRELEILERVRDSLLTQVLEQEYGLAPASP